MFVIEKNYRLQDIQLSKNPPPLPSAASARQARFSGLANLLVPASVRWLALPAFAFASGWLAEPKPRSRDRFGEAKAGGEYRARTGDLLVANQALSQLS